MVIDIPQNPFFISILFPIFGSSDLEDCFKNLDQIISCSLEVSVWDYLTSVIVCVILSVLLVHTYACLRMNLLHIQNKTSARSCVVYVDDTNYFQNISYH